MSLNISIFAQKTGEIWDCHTVNRSSKFLTLSRLLYNTSIKIINILIHIIRKSNGTGGLTNIQVNNTLKILRFNYN